MDKLLVSELLIYILIYKKRIKLILYCIMNFFYIQADELLRQVIQEALSYYHSLVIDGHRHAWDSCLILILTQLCRISSSERFYKHAIQLYPSFCDLVSMAGGISPQVAALIRLFLLCCSNYLKPPIHIN